MHELRPPRSRSVSLASAATNLRPSRCPRRRQPRLLLRVSEAPERQSRTRPRIGDEAEPTGHLSERSSQPDLGVLNPASRISGVVGLVRAVGRGHVEDGVQEQRRQRRAQLDDDVAGQVLPRESRRSAKAILTACSCASVTTDDLWSIRDDGLLI
jgi:hypothetical protein